MADISLLDKLLIIEGWLTEQIEWCNTSMRSFDRMADVPEYLFDDRRALHRKRAIVRTQISEMQVVTVKEAITKQEVK